MSEKDITQVYSSILNDFVKVRASYELKNDCDNSKILECVIAIYSFMKN
jgi:hypothetical protein